MQADAANNVGALMRPMMRELSENTDRNDMLAMGNSFIRQFPPEVALKVASSLSFANPFFVPDVPPQAARDLALSLDNFAEFTMRAKLTAKHAVQPNILVACAPKSASTFLHAALSKAMQLPNACLFTATLGWGSAAALGANLREQEPDELSLIRNGLNGKGYVAQHHARCSPYLSRLLTCYNVQPIVTHRNLLDTVVSMDDMVLEWRANPASRQYGFFSDGMPAAFERMERADRLMILAQRWAPWLTQFYVTWKKCERNGLIKPLWVSYENDFLGDKQVLATRIADFVGHDNVDLAELQAALEDKSDGKAKRINKGVAGRGRDLPVDVKDYILSVTGYYSDDEDLTPLIGE
jgi:hypothetical protein